jgi:formylglycine-generating enzyme required for sulfatase activity
LPTEAEWEYACRGGPMTDRQDSAFDWYFEFPTNELSKGQANFDLQRPTKVGSYLPNAWGLYDVHGNLLQWCSDWFEDTYYRTSPGTDPQGPGSGKLRVDRGGSWNGDARECRAATRSGHDPSHRLNHVGFRVVCTVRTP